MLGVLSTVVEPAWVTVWPTGQVVRVVWTMTVVRVSGMLDEPVSGVVAGVLAGVVAGVVAGLLGMEATGIVELMPCTLDGMITLEVVGMDGLGELTVP